MASQNVPQLILHGYSCKKKRKLKENQKGRKKGNGKAQAELNKTAIQPAVEHYQPNQQSGNIPEMAYRPTFLPCSMP